MNSTTSPLISICRGEDAKKENNNAKDFFKKGGRKGKKDITDYNEILTSNYLLQLFLVL